MARPMNQFLACVVFLAGASFAQESTPAAQPASPPQSAPAATQPAPPPPQSTPAPAQPTNAAPATAAAASASQSPRIAPGSVLPVQLTKTLDAKKVKAGDEVDVKVTQDLKANNGEVIVPKDTKVVGHVTEAQARSKDQKESQLAISFEKAVMKTGGDVNVPMSIQAVISQSALNGGPSNAGDAADSTQSPGSGRSSPAGRAQATPPSAPSGASGDASNDAKAHPPITGNTAGVVGLSDLKLSNTASQPSVLSSEKNNVKLDSGTLLLLKVNQ